MYPKGQSLRDVEDAVPYNETAKFHPKHGVSKGVAAPFADAPEGGEEALGLGKRNGVWQRK